MTIGLPIETQMEKQPLELLITIRIRMVSVLIRMRTGLINDCIYNAYKYGL